MVKRTRSNHRLDAAVIMAQQAHQEGWTEERVEEAIDSLLRNNLDLGSQKARATAASEARLMAHPRIRPFITRMNRMVERKMQAEPANTKRRRNHELMTVCRIARDHPVSVGHAVNEMEKTLRW